MISNLFRKLLGYLSFFYKNNLKLVIKNNPINTFIDLLLIKFLYPKNKQ